MTHTKDEALKLALDALETERDIYRENDVEDGAPEYIYEAITAIKQALAALTVQEPVYREYQTLDGVWHMFANDEHYKNTSKNGQHPWPVRELYTGPAAPVQKQVLGFEVVLDESQPPNTMKFVQPTPVPLTGKKRTLLAQAWAMLEDYAQDQRSHGNDSFADGAEASAHEIKIILTTPPAQPAPVQEPVAWGKPTDEMIQAATDEYDEWAVDNKGTTECIRAMLVKALKATPPAAQPAPVREDWGPGPHEVHSLPAPVQEPVRWSDYEPDGRRYPAVPDAFGTREGEHPQYIQGWNDCRAEMLKGMKP
jgi:hypothetical protein